MGKGTVRCMVSHPLNLLRSLYLDLFYEVVTGRVVTACEEEILPYEDAFSIADVVEVVAFYDTAAPYTDLFRYLLVPFPYSARRLKISKSLCERRHDNAKRGPSTCNETRLEESQRKQQEKRKRDRQTPTQNQKGRVYHLPYSDPPPSPHPTTPYTFPSQTSATNNHPESNSCPPQTP